MALPAGVKIRPARHGDRDAIYRLLSESGVTVASADQSATLSWTINHPEAEVLVAVDAFDKAIGLVALSHRPSLHVGGRLAVIESLAVARAQRRRGIGAELLDRAVARAGILGCKVVEVPAEGEGAKAFLTSRGFALTGAEVAARRHVGR